MWGTLFVIITTNNVAMNLVAGVLIVATFRYFSEKGLFWKDRAGLFPAEKGRVSFLVLLAAGVALCYVVYDLSVRVGVYGKIGRSQNYVDNLLGILFFVVGLVGVVSVSTNSVKNRILSILIGSRSVDARALEVYLAARRDVLKKQAKDEITGERLGTLLFARILEPSLGRLLGRIRVQIFVDDYLEHIMLHMMNSKCSVKKGQSTNSRTVIIEECVVCEGISSQAPACELVAGFLKGLVEAFLGLKGDDSIAFAAETECKATGKEACRIDLGWE